MSKTSKVLVLVALCVFEGAAEDGVARTNGDVMLAADTEIRLTFAETVSSKNASVDDFVRLLLDKDLIAQGIVIAKPGSPAVGLVSRAKKAEMLGEAGELSVRAEYLRVGNRRIRLRGILGREGNEKVGTAITLTILFGPVGLVKHGGNAEIKARTPKWPTLKKTFVFR